MFDHPVSGSACGKAVEINRDDDLAAEKSEPLRLPAIGSPERDNLCDRLASFGDYEGLAGDHILQQPGQVRLCLVDVDDFHVLVPAERRQD
jgi:hypothetical protein